MFNSLVKPPMSGLLRFVLLMLLILGLSLPAFAQAKPLVDLPGKNVLVLHAHEANAPVFVGTDKGLSDTLRSGGISGLNQFFEYLNLRRNPGSAYRRLLVAQMRMQYSHRKPDMIITMFPEALEFVLKDCRDVLRDVPILALYLPQSFKVPETERRIIGHFPTVDIMGSLEIALKLVPGAKRVYVVSGAHQVDRRVEDQARRISKKWEGRLEFVYLSHMPFEDMLATVSKVPPGSIILLLTFSQDVTGKNQTTPEVAQRLSQISTAPIFGILDVTLGHGVTGGSLISFELIGTKAGQLALDILSGIKPPDNIPAVLDVPSVPMFDWRELQRWNLSKAALPKGSIVINRKTTLWDFRYYIFGGLVFCLAETILIVFLIVQRRRKIVAEENLETSEERFRQFFKNIPDYCYIVSAEGNILHINEAALKTLGYNSEELIGKPLTMIYAPESLPKMKALFDQWKKEGEIKNEEMVIVTKNGEKRLVLLNVGAVRDEDEEVIHSTSIQTDITGWKQAQMEIEKQRQELIHVTRLGALGQLASSIAHEINQPLTAILSNAQAAQRFLDQKEPNLGELREILKDIIDDDKRAGAVIHKMRSLIKKKEFAFEKLDINNLIRETIAIVQGYVTRKNKTIKMQADPELPFVDGDHVQLQQVLLNLITNGVDAMADRGPAAQELVIRTSKNDSNSVVIAIKDPGGGLPDKDPHRVFEPFYTTKPEGLGMGLVISRSIVEGHGGTLHAENNPDNGATFFVTIPVEAEKLT